MEGLGTRLIVTFCCMGQECYDTVVDRPKLARRCCAWPFMLTLSSSDVVIATYDFTGQEGELSFKVCVSVIPSSACA